MFNLKDKPTEAEFNDHDNSRNDVGFRGGHRYDANGWNATKPVVLSADQSHFRRPRGWSSRSLRHGLLLPLRSTRFLFF